MQKLISVINSLDKYETKLFDRFISSSYFCSKKELHDLYLFFLKTKPQWKNADSKNEYAAIKKQSGIKDSEFTIYVSRLLQLIQDFLAYRKFEKDEMLFDTLRLKAMRSKKLFQSFQYLYNEFNRKSEKFLTHDDFYFYWYKNSTEFLEYQSETTTRGTVSFEQVQNQLDAYYVLKKLTASCQAINAGNIVAAQASSLFMKEILSEIEKGSFAGNIHIESYWMVYRSLVNPENELQAAQLQKMLSENASHFNKDELSQLYVYLKNYCVKQINLGNSAYMQRLFDIYNNILSDTRLLNPSFFSQWEFKNIVTLAIRLHQLEWADDFIKKHARYLDPGERENARLFNTAHVAFATGKYHEVRRLLQQVEFSDSYYMLDAKSILLKTYFETDEDEVFYSQAVSFRTYLSRQHRISGYQKLIYRNFIRCMLRLRKAGNNNALLRKLNTDIDSGMAIADKRWFQEKLAGSMV